MTDKKHYPRTKYFFKIPIREIIEAFLKKGDISKEEIAKKIKVTELTVINGSPKHRKGKAPPEV